jgi:hypothetical protein
VADRLDPKQRGALTLDAIEVVDAVCKGDWTVADVLALGDPSDVLDGLIQYATYLETVVHVTRGSSIGDIRQAARNASRALIERSA